MPKIEKLYILKHGSKHQKNQLKVLKMVALSTGPERENYTMMRQGANIFHCKSYSIIFFLTAQLYYLKSKTNVIS